VNFEREKRLKKRDRKCLRNVEKMSKVIRKNVKDEEKEAIYEDLVFSKWAILHSIKRTSNNTGI
jgi:hypothetical protein